MGALIPTAIYGDPTKCQVLAELWWRWNRLIRESAVVETLKSLACERSEDPGVTLWIHRCEARAAHGPQETPGLEEHSPASQPLLFQKACCPGERLNTVLRASPGLDGSF